MNNLEKFELITGTFQFEVWQKNPQRLLLVVPMTPLDQEVEKTQAAAKWVLKSLNDAAAKEAAS